MKFLKVPINLYDGNTDEINATDISRINPSKIVIFYGFGGNTKICMPGDNFMLALIEYYGLRELIIDNFPELQIMELPITIYDKDEMELLGTSEEKKSVATIFIDHITDYCIDDKKEAGLYNKTGIWFDDGSNLSIDMTIDKFENMLNSNLARKEKGRCKQCGCEAIYEGNYLVCNSCYSSECVK